MVLGYNQLRKGKSYQDIKRSFQGACMRAFVSRLVMAGVYLTTVKDLLGHKTLNMTLGYVHLAPPKETQSTYWIQAPMMNEVRNYYTVKGLQVSMQLITP